MTSATYQQAALGDTQFWWHIGRYMPVNTTHEHYWYIQSARNFITCLPMNAITSPSASHMMVSAQLAYTIKLTASDMSRWRLVVPSVG